MNQKEGLRRKGAKRVRTSIPEPREGKHSLELYGKDTAELLKGVLDESCSVVVLTAPYRSEQTVGTLNTTEVLHFRDLIDVIRTQSPDARVILSTDLGRQEITDPQSRNDYLAAQSRITFIKTMKRFTEKNDDEVRWEWIKNHVFFATIDVRMGEIGNMFPSPPPLLGGLHTISSQQSKICKNLSNCRGVVPQTDQWITIGNLTGEWKDSQKNKLNFRQFLSFLVVDSKNDRASREVHDRSVEIEDPPQVVCNEISGLVSVIREKVQIQTGEGQTHTRLDMYQQAGYRIYTVEEVLENL